MKKIIALALCLIMAAGLLASCSTLKKNDGKLKIVVSIFPVYDWVRQIVGSRSDSVEISLLLDKGVDLHRYQPTTDDIADIAEADLLIAVGGESDEWIDEVVPASGNKDLKVVRLLDVLGDKAKEEELVEGMQGEEEEEEGDEEEGPEYDEHIWLSLKNAAVLTQLLSQNIQKLDSKNAIEYKRNADTYISKLSALDSQYSKAVTGAKLNTLLYADRFPFRYLTEDYNLKYYAAFIGCSAESEASFETIKFLADKLKQLELPAVLTLEKSDRKIAKTVIEASGKKDVKILEMDSIQSVTQKEIKAGKNYLNTMEKNLETLKAALN